MRLEERPHCLCPSFFSCRARAKVRPGVKSKEAFCVGGGLILEQHLRTGAACIRSMQGPLAPRLLS